MNTALNRSAYAAWRRLLPIAALLLICTVAMGQDKPKPEGSKKDLPSAAKLLDKHIEALGGKAALEKVRNRVAKGTFAIPAQGFKGTVTVYVAEPDKARTTVDITGIGKMESGRNGDIVWEVSAVMGARILEGQERAMQLREMDFKGILHWTKQYKSAETVGEAVVDGKPCYKIEMTPKEEDKPATWYIDKESHLLWRVDMSVQNAMGTYETENYLEDYKDVDGVKIPMKSRTVVAAVEMEQVITLESVEQNVDLPKGVFDLPEAIKELAAQKKKP